MFEPGRQVDTCFAYIGEGAVLAWNGVDNTRFITQGEQFLDVTDTLLEYYEI